MKPKIRLVGRKDGFWLWDETREMNLSVRANTERDAFEDALWYYQGRLLDVEAKYKALQEKVDAFIAAVAPEDRE